MVEAWSVREENVLLLSAGVLTDGLYYREGVGEAWQQGKVGLEMQVGVVEERLWQINPLMRYGNANFDFLALLGEVLPVSICFLLSD